MVTKYAKELKTFKDILEKNLKLAIKDEDFFSSTSNSEERQRYNQKFKDNTFRMLQYQFQTYLKALSTEGVIDNKNRLKINRLLKKKESNSFFDKNSSEIKKWIAIINIIIEEVG